jgi:hypothetical protein
MPSGRSIVFSKACDDAAEKIGGYRRIDASLDAIWDPLVRNPYGFPSIQSDWYSARYIVTKPFGQVPALVWVFTIEQGGHVTIEHVELYDGY